ncbi:RagB/SusD family nutrient uptake outer membrane protein [Parapedobacter sp. 10938]|uniref:RagB/SusD family nutrient uptake outer membrane protein n=1 Tax=Parapedobacter flavus TaxID=3110225 RepID=UPI002DBB8551|nr:RagB/SusD family nutrient uptake outer membrane protein [Parapedobacter sp. 10938]MEC3878962.1 RagB/SusD family nutrient uptake outer membrane protein [Parapedobacter sp. 10938]
MKRKIIAICLAATLHACSYLEVVPDNVATLDNAFSMRSMAERYLFTCYSWLPNHADVFRGNPGFTAGDEFWFYSNITTNYNSWRIALGNQNVLDPIANFWNGAAGGKNLYRGIRECNIFLENIGRVEDISETERLRWIAEVKFLKAYYHFWLVRMYGPIPLIRENLPITASVAEINSITRQPIDDCFDYIVSLLDEAALDLPDMVQFEVQEDGRITKPIALSVKALVLVTAASPLFNGNQDYTHFVGPDDNPFFDPQFSQEKWEHAAQACIEAINLCRSVGMELYRFIPGSGQSLSDTTLTELSIRNSVTQRWNSEIIWANTNSMVTQSVQVEAQPRLFSGTVSLQSRLAPPLKIAEMFYSRNGVPIEEDLSYDYVGRYSLRTAVPSERLYLKEGGDYPVLHFDREPRFYASLAFDGNRWYGQGNFDDEDNLYIEAKFGGVAAGGVFDYSVTGYWPKKLVNYLNVANPNTYTAQPYPWPIFRLADLYLLGAEAINEAYGPSRSSDVFELLDPIRERAGLLSVEEAWSRFSSQPIKHTTQQGLRDIIRRERMIELAFESHRFWDVKRWKMAQELWNEPITGWDRLQEVAELYYRPRLLFQQKFNVRDYFWPIRESELLINKGLVQSPGW